MCVNAGPHRGPGQFADRAEALANGRLHPIRTFRRVTWHKNKPRLSGVCVRCGCVLQPRVSPSLLAVALARVDYAPARRHRGDESAAVEVEPVHQPDRILPRVVTPQDVGFAVAVEVAHAHDAQVGSGTKGSGRSATSVGPVHEPDRVLPGAVLRHRMSALPSPLKSPTPAIVQLVEPDAWIRGLLVNVNPFISQIAFCPCWCRATGCRPCRRR